MIGPLPGRIKELKYADHDLTELEKFSWFQMNYYLQVTSDGQGGEVITPLDWAENLHHTTILNAIRIPHFGRGPKINSMVRLLLTRMHGGYLWMDSRISLNSHLIWWIRRLRKQGRDPFTTFVDKKKDKKRDEQLKR